MTPEQAKNLIIQTFEDAFNKEKFVNFISNLLKSYDKKKASPPTTGILGTTARFKDFISSRERIGRYKDANGKIIDILIVKLKNKTSLYRARTAQRNFVASYLQAKFGTTTQKDAALVAFISPDTDDWRFSFVKMEYRFIKTPKGQIKVKAKFTPAKRWSFLVGKNEKSHTAQTRFKDLLVYDDKPNLSDLEKAFDVEVVTKEFFEKYRNLFIRTKTKLDEIIQSDPKVKAEFTNKNINTVDFTKKLLGQIVFLYFLQRKGWFGVEKGGQWGTGHKDFMRKLFEKEIIDYNNFFNDILEPLFYEALRNDRSHDDHFYQYFNCKIPFLNGGLFDPINNYDWVNTDIVIPNEIFSNDQKDGILDVFDLYNFTVNEEEPLEKEVALDPELLGKIYEKLNAIREDNFDEYVSVLKSGKKGDESKFNKEYGVYYTPREIVHYMCQESLINYLETELNGKVAREDIEQFVRFADSIIEAEEIATQKDAKIASGEQKDTSYKHYLSKDIIENATTIDKLLDEVKILDPAVGSGAFPIGMLHEIVKLRLLLSKYLRNKKSTYDLKREAIEKTLYGVDIDAGAVEICKLRFWLSLVVDEEDFKDIKPLPNLDYKIVCGNSLLGVEKNIFNHEALEKIENLKPQFFNETNPLKKQQLKDQIDQLIFQVTDGHKEFDFEIYFSEVFHYKKGFDIVIANPPYVRQELIKNKEELIKNVLIHFNDVKINRRSDLYVYFYYRGLALLKKLGIFCYINSNSWLDVGYGVELQEFLLKKMKPLMIVDNLAERSFEADVNTIIVLIQKPNGNISDDDLIKFVALKRPFNEILSSDILTQINKSDKSIINDDFRMIVKTRKDLWIEGIETEDDELKDNIWKYKYIGNKWGGKYLRAPEIFFKILEKGKDKLVRLGDIAEVKFGIKTGANEFFYLEPTGQSAPAGLLHVKNSAGWEGYIEEEFLKPVIKSPRELKTILVREEDLKYKVFMCHKSKEQLKGTYALKYIEWGEKQGYSRRPTCATRPRWWDLGSEIIGHLCCMMSLNDRYIFWQNQKFLVDARLYDIYVKNDNECLLLSLFINCSLTPLFVELGARSNLGEGALDFKVYEAKNILVFSDMSIQLSKNKLLINFLNRPIFSIFEELGFQKCTQKNCNHPEHPYEYVKPEEVSFDLIMPDRRELDKIIFEVLGLTEEEQLEVYRAVLELVKNRLLKAKSR